MNSGSSINDLIQGVFGPVVDVLETVVFFAVPIFGADVPVLVIWLFAGSVFLTCWLRVRPIRDAVQTFRVVRGHLSRHRDPGEVTSFQALATELSGTVGLGNIAGVAVAVSIGGPGATLWIIIAGVLGMAVKMAEATLAQMFRRVHSDGKVSGGPMYYLRDGLASVGRPKLGKTMAFIYAFCLMIAVMGAGNLFQSNQMTAHLIDATGGDEGPLAGYSWAVGVVLAVIAGLVILGGIKTIAKMTSRLVPVMTVLYGGSVIIILAVNFNQLPEAVRLIVHGGLTGESIQGGMLGVAVIGIQRALFSNVAGVGTAGMAHAVTKNRRPAEEGFVAAWEPFLDSVVVCTMTALAIIVTGSYGGSDVDGINLTTQAFASVHSAFPYLLTVCIALFAFSTILSYSYYGKKAAGYVFGQSRVAERIYDVVYLVMIVVGASVTLDTVVRFSDAMFFLVTVPNLLGIYLLGKVLRREIQGYRHDAACGRIPLVPEEERSTMLGRPMSDKIAEAGLVSGRRSGPGTSAGAESAEGRTRNDTALLDPGSEGEADGARQTGPIRRGED